MTEEIIINRCLLLYGYESFESYFGSLIHTDLKSDNDAYFIEIQAPEGLKWLFFTQNHFEKYDGRYHIIYSDQSLNKV